MNPGFPRTGLAVTHPSHELRVFGWLELTRPRVYVFTDGSGRRREPRLRASAALLEKVGATTGPLFGPVTDLEVYAAVLRRDIAFFVQWALALAEDLARSRIESLAGDAAEGHNSAHDVWRGVVDAAVEIAAQRFGWPIQSYDFTLFGHPAACPEALKATAIWVRLDDPGFERKRSAVAGYSPKLAAEVDALLGGALRRGTDRFADPALALAAASEAGIGLDDLVRFPELLEQIQRMVAGIELDAFRVECLRPVTPFVGLGEVAGTPFYEAYGERLVQAGHYREVIRCREHVAPILDGLRQWRDHAPA